MTQWMSWTLDTPTRRARLIRILYGEAVKRQGDVGVVARVAGTEAPFVTFLKVLDDLGLYVALDSLDAEPREWPTDTLEGVPVERITRVRQLPSARERGQGHEISEEASVSSTADRRPDR